MFAYYGIKSFKCELLSKELFDEVPGEYSVNESQKRNLSNSSSIISITNNPRRRLKGTTDDISESTVRIESLDGVKNLSRVWVLYKKF